MLVVSERGGASDLRLAGIGRGLARSRTAGPRALIARASIEAQVRGLTQTYFNLPAFLPGVAMGTKIATILPDNPTRFSDVPAVQALYALFDGDDGSPAAVMDGTALTYRKTAANSALGSQLLSRAGFAGAAAGGGGRIGTLSGARASGDPAVAGPGPGLESDGGARRGDGGRGCGRTGSMRR